MHPSYSYEQIMLEIFGKYKQETWKSVKIFVENTNMKYENMLEYLWKYKYETWKSVQIFVEMQI